MLSRVNRVRRATDFRTVVRSGRRTTTPVAVVYERTTGEADPSRFGFIVGKNVGNSVVRHRITRQLRAIAFEILPAAAVGRDVVVRALPASADAGWATLQREVASAIGRSGSR